MTETSIINAEHSSQLGHWYEQDGSPAYEIIGKNGRLRATTVRDARKYSLLPSVTKILKCADKPGLRNWQDDQIILACLTLPRIADEPEADYIARIKHDAKEQAAQSAERGTIIHARVQGGFEGDNVEDLYYLSARQAIASECGAQTWICEQSFALDGYGGKVDIHSNDIVIDFKTTEKDLSTIKTWDEHAQQLAAYRHGLGMDEASAAILYIHVASAESKLIWISEKDLTRGFCTFCALKDYWYAVNW